MNAKLLFYASVSSFSLAFASTIRVPQDYSKIQTAINVSQASDSIFVDVGTYIERLNIKKSIYLIGKGVQLSQIVPAQNGIFYQPVIIIDSTDNVLIKGFSIGAEDGIPHSGVKISHSKNIRVILTSIQAGSYPTNCPSGDLGGPAMWIEYSEKIELDSLYLMGGKGGIKSCSVCQIPTCGNGVLFNAVDSLVINNSTLVGFPPNENPYYKGASLWDWTGNFGQDTSTVYLDNCILDGNYDVTDRTFLKMSNTTILFVNDPPTKIQSFLLFQNYPNPFNPMTTIDYELQTSGFITLSIFDMLGRKTKTLVNKQQDAGKYSIKFNGSDLMSGFYFYLLKSGKYSSVKKCVLLK